MKHVAACTISSNNYLGMTRVLVESYLEHHPGAQVFVCIVDRPDLRVPYSQMPFTPIFAEDLGIPSFRNFAFRYDILELNTAVKPYVLAYLRDHYGLDRVFYFDPDIMVYDRLDTLVEALDTHAAVLTPHVAQPLDNTYDPSEIAIRAAGVYNLGFLGIRFDSRTDDFLEWWQDRLWRYCYSDLPNGLFVDQSWMDYVPCMIESVAIARDSIYNIAYWNLPHRFPKPAGDHWEVDGRRVGFVHFSGLNLDELDVISRHQNRLDLQKRPELRSLFEDYRERVMDAGFESLRGLPYHFDRFSNGGLRIPREARLALRAADPDGMRWPDPFDTEGPDSFFTWFTEPVEFHRGFLTRAAISLWERRADLMSSFPRLEDEDLPAYVHWLSYQEGGRSVGLASEFLCNLRVKPGFDIHEGGMPEVKTLPQITPHSVLAVGNEEEILQSVDLACPGTLRAWLNQPVTNRAQSKPVLTRLAMLLHRRHPNLQRAYPDPLGKDQPAFAYWFALCAAADHGVAPQLVEPVRASLPLKSRLGIMWRTRAKTTMADPNPSATNAVGPDSTELLHGPGLSFAESGADYSDEPLPALEKTEVEPGERSSCREKGTKGREDGVVGKSPTVGVNVAGYFEMPTGVGQIGRGTLAALAASRFEVARVLLDQSTNGETVLRGGRVANGTPFPITLMHANAEMTPTVLNLLPIATRAGSFKIGYWFWELSHFPIDFADRFYMLNEVWAPTRFCQNAVDVVSSIPVRYVPPCALPPTPVAASRSSYGMDEDCFYFLYAFDVASIPERKNPMAAIFALRRLLRETSRPVGLVLKLSQACINPELVERLRREATGLPVVLITETTPRGTMERLLASADAVLHLHRSEGLGLLPIECMYLGKPVVATEYGGVTDFLDDTTGFPVAYDLRHLESSYPPYPAGAVWAEPRIDHAVERMLEVVEGGDEVAERATAGRRRVEEIYSVDAAGRRFAAELERIWGWIHPHPSRERPS